VTTIDRTSSGGRLRRSDAGRWAVYELHAPAIRAYAARRVEPDAIDDVVAETFAIAWRKLPREADPLPWLYAVARRVAHGHRRSHARRSALLVKVAASARDAVPDPAEQIHGNPALARAFATLTEQEREAIRLVAWECLEHGDAARAAGCSRATFAVRLSRARLRLRKALGDHEEQGRAQAPPDRAEALPSDRIASMEAPRRRARAGGAAGGIAVFLSMLAIGFWGSDRSEDAPITAALPGVEHVIAQAAHAADASDGRILEVTSIYGLDSTIGGDPPERVARRSTTWIRLDGRGRVAQMRSLTRTGSAGILPGLDSASSRGAGAGPWWTEVWEPPNARAPRGRFRRIAMRLVANSMILRAAAILRRAQAGRGPHVALVGEVTVGGRRAYRLRIDSIDAPPRHRGYKELFVDAVTYAPLKLTQRTWGRSDNDGSRYDERVEEVIVERRLLDDTAQNRRLLEVRGPTR
jgi:RNA polymerase sigma-70 factor (ECF subfamily)